MTSKDERRAAPRRATDFCAVEHRGASSYYRLVRNVSESGLLFENRLADEKPGQMVDLELPRPDAAEPVRVRGEVVYVRPGGFVGVRLLDKAANPDVLGGVLSL